MVEVIFYIRPTQTVHNNLSSIDNDKCFHIYRETYNN